jgi:hypothetical protein
MHILFAVLIGVPAFFLIGMHLHNLYISGALVLAFLIWDARRAGLDWSQVFFSVGAFLASVIALLSTVFSGVRMKG